MEREYCVGNQLKIVSTNYRKLVKNEFADRVMDNALAPVQTGPSPLDGNSVNDMYDVEQIVGSRLKNVRFSFYLVYFCCSGSNSSVLWVNREDGNIEFDGKVMGGLKIPGSRKRILVSALK